MKYVSLGLKLRRWQKEVDTSIFARAKYITIVSARQRGKTKYLQYRLFRELLRSTKKTVKILFGGPSIEHILDLYWYEMEDFAKRIGNVTLQNRANGNLQFSLNLKDRIVKVFCYFRGSENSTRMVGQAYDLGICDEMGLWKKGVFFGSLFPAFEQKGGDLWITGTVRGPDDYYELYSRFTSKMKAGDDRYWTTIKNIYDTYTPQHKIDELLELYKNNMELFNREYMCDWFSGVRGYIYSEEVSKARASGRIGQFKYDPSHPVLTVWDIGIRAKTVLWFYQHIGSNYYFIDYAEGVENVLDYYVEIIKGKDFKYDTHYLPHDAKRRDRVNLVPYVKHLEEKLGSGYGYSKALPKVISTDLAIDSTKELFKNFYFDEEHCAEGIKALSLWKRVFNPERGAFANKPEDSTYSHAPEALQQVALTPEARDGIISKDRLVKKGFKPIAHRGIQLGVRKPLLGSYSLNEVRKRKKKKRLF